MKGSEKFEAMKSSIRGSIVKDLVKRMQVGEPGQESYSAENSSANNSFDGNDSDDSMSSEESMGDESLYTANTPVTIVSDEGTGDTDVPVPATGTEADAAAGTRTRTRPRTRNLSKRSHSTEGSGVSIGTFSMNDYLSDDNEFDLLDGLEYAVNSPSGVEDDHDSSDTSMDCSETTENSGDYLDNIGKNKSGTASSSDGSEEPNLFDDCVSTDYKLTNHPMSGNNSIGSHIVSKKKEAGGNNGSNDGEWSVVSGESHWTRPTQGELVEQQQHEREDAYASFGATDMSAFDSSSVIHSLASSHDDESSQQHQQGSTVDNSDVASSNSPFTLESSSSPFTPDSSISPVTNPFTLESLEAAAKAYNPKILPNTVHPSFPEEIRGSEQDDAVEKGIGIVHVPVTNFQTNTTSSPVSDRAGKSVPYITSTLDGCDEDQHDPKAKWGCAAYYKRQSKVVRLTICVSVLLLVLSVVLVSISLAFIFTRDQKSVPGVSPAPTRAPTSLPPKGGCFDDPSLQFKDHALKNCDWVKMRPKVRCLKEWNGTTLYEYCQKTCGVCGGGKNKVTPPDQAPGNPDTVSQTGNTVTKTTASPSKATVQENVPTTPLSVEGEGKTASSGFGILPQSPTQKPAAAVVAPTSGSIEGDSTALPSKAPTKNSPSPVLPPPPPVTIPLGNSACVDGNESFVVNGVARDCTFLAESPANKFLQCQPTREAYSICLKTCNNCPINP